MDSLDIVRMYYSQDVKKVIDYLLEWRVVIRSHTDKDYRRVVLDNARIISSHDVNVIPSPVIPICKRGLLHTVKRVVDKVRRVVVAWCQVR